MDSILSIIINIINFSLVMGIIVLIHELGHLVAAKAFGVYCQEFAIGMGPTIFKVKKPNWETTFSIRLLPLGGFVSMAGEPGEADLAVPASRTIKGIARWKQLIVMLAGIFMNFVLAFVIFTGLFLSQGVYDEMKPVIAELAPNSPAEKAGLHVNDEVKELIFFDGSQQKIQTFSEIGNYINTYGDHEIKVVVDRSGEEKIITLTPMKNGDVYQIGIVGQRGDHRSLSLFGAMAESFHYIAALCSTLYFVLTRLVQGIGMDAIGGPIQIFAVTSQVQEAGFIYFLQLVAVFSVNLAVVNLLPIPIMDGGRALITMIEMIIRRPLPEKLENIIMYIGLAMVIFIFVFVMINDISRLL